MREQTRITEDGIYLVGYPDYYSTAITSLKKIRELNEESERLLASEEEGRVDKAIKIFTEIAHHSVFCIIFSAMTLESFINAYILDFFPEDKNFVEKYLDRQVRSIKAKYVIYSEIATGVQFDRSSKAFMKLKELINNRNKLVHDKPTKVKPGLAIQSYPWNLATGDVAEEAIETVKLVINEMKKTDNEIKTDWMDKLHL